MNPKIYHTDGRCRSMWLLVGLLSIAGGLHCQTAFPTASAEVEQPSGSLSYTVGQIAVQAVPAGQLTHMQVYLMSALTEGVQQSYLPEGASSKAKTLTVSLAPNPTTRGLTLTPSDATVPYTLRLYTDEGRLLQQQTVNGGEVYIDMEAYPSGSYMLHIQCEGQRLTYRIVRIR